MPASEFDFGEGLFFPQDAAKILGIPNNRASYWFRSYAREKFDGNTNRKFFKSGDTYGVNFLTLIEMFVFFKLKEGGISSSRIIKAHKAISEKYETPYPFALEGIFFDKKDVFFEDSHGSFVKADETLQVMIREVLQPFCQKVEYGDLGVAERYYPLGKNKTIVVDPDHQLGYPTIEGTNIVVDTVAELYNAGEDITTISRLYEIEHAQVEDAIAYYNAA